jgi:hypothetical protein
MKEFISFCVFPFGFGCAKGCYLLFWQLCESILVICHHNDLTITMVNYLRYRIAFKFALLFLPNDLSIIPKVMD